MKFTFILFFFCTFWSCRDHPDKAQALSPAAKDTTPAEPYYPVTGYILNQLDYVDSTPLAIEKITFVNNRQADSVLIDRPTLKQMASEFMVPDLNDKKVKPLYEENAYNDLSLNTITFNYTARDKSLELQEEDVLLNPDNNFVKNVMFRKIRRSGDTVYVINGLWKHNMNFQLNYSYQLPSQAMQTRQVKVIWDRPREQW